MKIIKSSADIEIPIIKVPTTSEEEGRSTDGEGHEMHDWDEKLPTQNLAVRKRSRQLRLRSGLSARARTRTSKNKHKNSMPDNVMPDPPDGGARCAPSRATACLNGPPTHN